MAVEKTKWRRYIVTSVSDQIRTAAQAAGLPLFVEGVDDRNRQFVESPHRAELSIHGPIVRKVNPKFYRVWVNLFCILTSQMGGKVTNVGEHFDFSGVLQDEMGKPIPIYSYDVGDDEPEFVGCLHPRSDANESVQLTPIKPSTNEKQTTTIIESRYVGYFTQ